jgi:hypothetical protein
MNEHEETVREFLRRRGCPDTVVARGLTGLLESWERTVEAVGRGYPYGLDDYLNDIDGRQLIEDAWGAASDVERVRIEARLAAADEKLRALTEVGQRCLWGGDVANYHGWSREKNWWYWSVPRQPGEDLAADLEARPG